MMFRRFTVRDYVVSLLKVVGGMALGAAVATLFRSSPFAGEAIGGICALGFVALERYTTVHRQH